MPNTRLGLCTSPSFAKAAVENNHGAPFIRSILYSIADAVDLAELGKPLIITLNNECKEVGSDWSGWDGVVFSLANMFGKNGPYPNKLLVLGAANELDIYYDQDNTKNSPAFAADLAIRAAHICHSFGIKVSPTSVAGANWPAYIADLANLCRNEVDYFDFHPYGKQPNGWRPMQEWGFGKLDEAIKYIQNLSNKPVICTEYGVKIQDAGGDNYVAGFMSAAYETLSDVGVPFCGWFASEDAVGAPDERGGAAFGLISDRGEKRPAYYEYARINPYNASEPIPPGVPTVPPVILIDYLKWSNKVGNGLLTMMKADNVEPIMASEWRPFDRPTGVAATVEECIATDGSTYRWLLPLNKGFRLRPS